MREAQFELEQKTHLLKGEKQQITEIEIYEQPGYLYHASDEIDKKAVYLVKENIEEILKANSWKKNLISIIITIIYLVVGVKIAMIFSEDSSFQKIIGSVIFTGALIPFLNAAKSLILGAKSFFKNNLMKVISSSIFMGIGLILTATAPDKDKSGTWQDFAGNVGQSLFETGLIMIIGNLFFMQEDQEWQIQNLKVALFKSKKSAGAGLAISYFFNYLKPTVEKLDQTAIFKIKMGTEQKEFKAAQDIKFEIYIPRTLIEDNIRNFVVDIKAKQLVYEGQQISGASQFRTTFLNFRGFTADQVRGIVDVPTVISSIFMRAKIDEQQELLQPDLTDDKRMQIKNYLENQIRKEILDFQNQLVTLINNEPSVRGKVRIISIPVIPVDLEKVTTLVDGNMSKKTNPEQYSLKSIQTQKQKEKNL